MLALVCALTANAQLLYSISGKDLKKPSYVFGTFHIANTPFVARQHRPGVRRTEMGRHDQS